ncbi:hypothetical protein Tco_1111143 [Tanacetum coccineum]|uniref:Uncharacterized protein n=1 Tax=Tanacetum coccineum TaxID=301880 RepID=A0ABQ5IM89_9ASTR
MDETKPHRRADVRSTTFPSCADKTKVRLTFALTGTDISKITKKTVKNGQARTRESEGVQKQQPKDQSRSQKKNQAQSKSIKPQSNPIKYGQ